MTDRTLEGAVVMTALGVAWAGQCPPRWPGGAKVAMIDIDEDVLNEAAKLAENAGGQGSAKAFICDVTDAGRVAATAEEIVATFDRWTCWSTSGHWSGTHFRFMTKKSKFWELDDDLWNAMLRVNIFGPQLMAKICAPYMIQRVGRIVNVTTSLDTR